MRPPTLIAQGLADELVLPDVQRAFAYRLCEAGQPLDFRTYEGRDHVAVVAADSPLIPELIGWTKLRTERSERRIYPNHPAHLRRE